MKPMVLEQGQARIPQYKVSNEIYEEFIGREWTVLSLVQVANLEDEMMTGGSPYNFDVLNILETGHLGKMITSPNW